MNFKELVAKIKSKFKKTLDQNTIEDYERELDKFLDDIYIITDPDVVDQLISELGIAGTAKEYANINSLFKSYHMYLIRELNKADNVEPELKRRARNLIDIWNTNFRRVINYLYKRKNQIVYGESVEPDFFSGVKVYHANSFANKELPWLRKESINEVDGVDHFDEGLVGVASGGISGAVLGLVLSSLGKAFKVNPGLLTGVSTALGAIIGHFIQKHYFIDFTNYIKLKRYVEYEPQSYDLIIEMMERNAEKFRQKDPAKYKKILQNLKRLQKNPPQQYRSYLDDEEEFEDQMADMEVDDVFDVTDERGNIIKQGNSGSSLGGSNYSREDRYREYVNKRNRNRRYNKNYSVYGVRDLTDQGVSSLEDIETSIAEISRGRYDY